MAKSPAFQFYPKDWLTDIHVIMMDNEARGMYIQLLCYDWLEDGIPEDPQVWLKLCGCKGQLSDYKVVITQLSNCYKHHISKPGYVTNPRLQIEREKQAEWHLKCSEGGKKGMQTRWGSGSSVNKKSHKGTYNSVITKSLLNDNSSFASSSSINIKDKSFIYGKYRHVRLTQEQYDKLKARFNSKADAMIQMLDDGIELKGYKYKNHYLAILKWHENDLKKNPGTEDAIEKWIQKQERGHNSE